MKRLVTERMAFYAFSFILSLMPLQATLGAEYDDFSSELESFELRKTDTYPIAILSINGRISKSLLEQIKVNLYEISSQNIMPGHLIVTIDSNGGDAMAAIEIGRLLRKNNAFIFVTNRCASACVFVLVGGVYRSSIPQSIGIHSTKVTISDKNAKILKEIDVDSSESAKKVMFKFNADLNQYFIEMNANKNFGKKLKSLSSPKLYWLKDEEAQAFELNGFDPVFFEREQDSLKSQLGPSLSKLELIEKLNSTLRECVYFKNEPRKFSSCYRKNLGR